MTEPVWLQYARKQIGVREIRGPKHDSRIMAMVKRTARFLGITVNDDETPWCGTFAADCVLAAGHTPPKIAVRAKSWATWGVALPTFNPPLGAVAVFERPGGGHVGFIVGETKTHFLILGGNQKDSVKVMRLEKERCIAVRWPTGVPVGRIPAPYLVATNADLSTNEA